MAATILVPDHWSSIQAGIDAARNGDVVTVRPGTYREQLDFQGKAIVLQGSGARRTVINGSSLGSHVRGAMVQFHQGEGPDTVLDGFTITGRKDGAHHPGGIDCVQSSPTIIRCIIKGNEGAGIECDRFAAPTITDCTITKNRGSWGGGIYCVNSEPTITECTITENLASLGGGIYCFGSSPTLSNCSISGNGGGGIYCYLSDPTLANCFISGNESLTSGAGLYCSYSSPELTNCVINGNRGEQLGGGAYAADSSPRFTYCTIFDNYAEEGGGIYSEQTTTLYGCIVWGNGPSDSREQNLSTAFCNIEGGYTGQGNIEADPQFVSYRDFHYLLAAGSPCIDAGSGEISDGIRWPSWYPNGRRSDMGAWGGPDAVGWLR